MFKNQNAICKNSRRGTTGQAARATLRLLLLMAAAVAFAGVARSAPRVVITIDVESIPSLNLPSQIDASCEDGSGCGLMEIVRLLNARDMQATFFLNVYEYAAWGDDTMRDIVSKLQAAGQDVALHTHPQWAYDAERWAMHQYSLEEQIAIVRDGVERLSEWSGQPVVAHRAGGYAADANTLEALDRNGILIDSSFFWEHPWSRLHGLGLARNLPSSQRRPTQIPVTVYWRELRPSFAGRLLGPVADVRKVDPDWFINGDEARASVEAIVDANLPILVVFLHSFSFLMDKNGLASDYRSRDLFRSVLDAIAERNLKVVTMRNLAEQQAGAIVAAEARDVIPRVAVRSGWGRYLWHRLKGLKAEALATGLVALLTLLAAAFLVVARRRKKAHRGTGRRLT